MDPVIRFFRDGGRLLNRCTKPDKREFVRICKVVTFGVCFMGGLGVFIKLTVGTHYYVRQRSKAVVA